MTQQAEPSIRDFSPATHLAMQLFRWARCISPSVRLNRSFPKRFNVFRPHNELTAQELASADFVRRRGRGLEIYIGCWVALEMFLALLVVAYSWAILFRFLAVMIVATRMIEILQVTINAAFFDVLNGRVDDRIAARGRVIVLSIIHYLELCVCFGIIYGTHLERLHGADTRLSAFYFSVISQLTIGFGDIYPVGWLRVVAVAHGLLNLLFVVLVLGRFVALLQTAQEATREDGGRSRS